MNEIATELRKIAHEINVIQDPMEDEIEWKQRLFYSICGRMGLASLWDCPEDEDISVQHFKSRCMELLEAFENLCPEIVSQANYGDHDFDLIEGIYNLYYLGGQFYHKRNRLSPSKPAYLSIGDVSMIKGLYATDICFMSGLGPYLLVEEKGFSNESFHFNHPKAELMLDTMVNNAQWREVPNDIDNYSFLRTRPPYGHGYWVKNRDRNQGLSLIRYDGDVNSPKQYFLVKIENDKVRISDLPEWISKNRMHVYLSLAMLRHFESLPPITIRKYKTIAMLEISYRLPPEEETLVKMYSWPQQYDGEDRPFKRIISIELLEAMKSLFAQMGFEIQEVRSS